jgi:hypothetical protein
MQSITQTFPEFVKQQQTSSASSSHTSTDS